MNQQVESNNAMRRAEQLANEQARKIGQSTRCRTQGCFKNTPKERCTTCSNAINESMRDALDRIGEQAFKYFSVTRRAQQSNPTDSVGNGISLWNESDTQPNEESM